VGAFLSQSNSLSLRLVAICRRPTAGAMSIANPPLSPCPQIQQSSSHSLVRSSRSSQNSDVRLTVRANSSECRIWRCYRCELKHVRLVVISQPERYIGVGFFFALVMMCLTYLQARFTDTSPSASEEFTVMWPGLDFELFANAYFNRRHLEA
jgi:hypothetical protein